MPGRPCLTSREQMGAEGTERLRNWPGATQEVWPPCVRLVLFVVLPRGQLCVAPGGAAEGRGVGGSSAPLRNSLSWDTSPAPPVAAWKSPGHTEWSKSFL